LTAPIVVQLVKPPDATKSNFLYRRGQQVTSVPGVDGLPFLKPPYSRVTAIDLHAGSLAWTSAIGDGPRNHPLLKDLNLPPLGGGGRGNPLVTKTLLFIAQGTGNIAGAAANLPVGGRPLSPRQPPDPRYFHALDKATGEVVWKTTLPLAGPMAVPMTYLYEGRQYIVMAVGAGPEAALIAYAIGS
jgi:quinoprotein glucose dehydrogenase